jgi:two-component sensor histidine kinase
MQTEKPFGELRRQAVVLEDRDGDGGKLEVVNHAGGGPGSASGHGLLMSMPGLDTGSSQRRQSTGTGAVLDPGSRWRRSLPLSILLSLLTLAALAPFLGLGAYAVHARVQSERAAELTRVSGLAGDLAKAVDRELRGHIETAQVVAGSRSLQQGDIRGFWEHAEDASSRANGHFILIDRSYQQLVNTRVAIGTPLPKTANPAAVDEVLRSGEVRVGNLGVGAVAKELLFAVRLPIHIENEVRYVLSYVPRTGAMLTVIEETYRPEGWFSGIIDANGRIVARSHRHDEFLGRGISPDVWSRIEDGAGILETVDLEGRPSITAYHASEISGWTVFVWVPRILLEEPAERAQRLLLLLVALALAASLTAAFFTGRLIQKPASRLIDAAHDLGEGKPVAFAPCLMREANTVGEALVEAAETIHSREAALRETGEHMQIVMQELSHRTKNLLAVIQGMATNSARMSHGFDDFRTSFEERLAGLARSHDLLVQNQWSSVPLAELVTSQLRAFTDQIDTRLTLQGPPLLLKPQAVQNLGMALHELATNALKHGSLSTPSGRVDVTWERRIDGHGAERVLVRWEESGGPSVVCPTRGGFGFLLIEKVASASLHGTVRLDWRPGGLVWEIEAPASFMLS